MTMAIVEATDADGMVLRVLYEIMRKQPNPQGRPAGSDRCSQIVEELGKNARRKTIGRPDQKGPEVKDRLERPQCQPASLIRLCRQRIYKADADTGSHHRADRCRMGRLHNRSDRDAGFTENVRGVPSRRIFVSESNELVPRKICWANDVQGFEWMPLGDSYGHSELRKLIHLNTRPIDLVGDDSEIELTGSDQIAHVGRHASLERHGDIRIASHEDVKGARKDICRQGRKTSDPQFTRPVISYPCSRSPEMAQAEKSVFDLTEEELTLGRWVEPALDPLKKGETKRALKLLYHFADCGLGHVQDLSRARRSSVGHDHPKHFNLAKIHRAWRPPSITLANRCAEKMHTFRLKSLSRLQSFGKALV